MSEVAGEEELTVLTGADVRYLEDHKVSDQKMILVENYNNAEEDKPKKKMLIHRNASINQYFNAYTSNKSLTRNVGSTPEK